MRERMLLNGRRLQMAGVVTALIAGVLWAGLPAHAAGTMTVTPTPTGLTHGATLELHFSGFPGTLNTIDFAQCTPDPQGADDCGPSESTLLSFGSGDGVFVAQVMFAGSGAIDCHKDKPCVLFAWTDPTDFSSNSASVPLSFSDNGPVETTTTTTAPGGTTTTTLVATTTTTTGATTTTTGGGTTTTKAGGTTTTTAGTTVSTVVKSTRGEATPADPIATKVSSPVSVTGSVEVSEAKTNTSTAPAGLTLLNGEVKITAPTATAATPHRLEFRLDASILGGRDENAIVLVRNGTAVPNCAGTAATQANPDPCLAARAKSGDDVVLTALASQGSIWNFAYSTTGATTSTTASGATTTTLRSAAAPVTTLPATGVRPIMMWLCAIGVGLSGAGSVVRRQALRAG